MIYPGLLVLSSSRRTRQAVIRFFENVEGIRNVFERESDQARVLNVDYTGGPDLFLETETGYVFLPDQMLDLYHGQHGSRDDSDMIVPIICFGAGIPSGIGIEPSDLRCLKHRTGQSLIHGLYKKGEI